MRGLYIAEFVLTFLEVEMGLFVCDGLLERKGKYSFAGLELTGALVIALLCGNKFFYGTLFSNTAWLAVMVVFVLTAKAGYRERWPVIAAVFTLFYAGMFILDFLILIVASLVVLNERLGMDLLNVLSWRRVTVFGTLCLAECGLLWRFWRRRGLVVSWIRQEGWLYAGLGLAGFYFMTQVQNIGIKRIDLDFFWAYAGDILAAAGIAAVCLFWPVFKKSQEEKRILEQEQEVQRRVNEKLREENRENRRRLHDGKNYLQMIEGLIREGRHSEAEACLQKLLKRKGSGKRVTRTGDGTLDLFLNEKVSQAEEKGVTIRIDTGLFTCLIDPLDLCGIFGNLLDNAVEACEGLEEARRAVSVKLRTQGRTLYGEIRNFSAAMPRKRDDTWLSSKRGFLESGEGIGIVRRLTEKYQGELSLFQEGDEFCAAFVLIMEKSE
ncbi:MAG: GHKL domain-containing protein [Lachnospiraceae bacterium]|nr:GHKL domain-containing protein [Lachnospiraceae bacterium]